MNSNSTFSKNKRHFFIENSKEEFDLLVIGGGITGAGIALDAASRGLKVILIEKKDYAWGTSSRSTKLIHGGLRYLKQLEIKLVREVGLERAIVQRNAPHIVLSEKMLLPIIKGGDLSYRLSSFALYVYDFLAKVQGKERRVMLSKERTKKTEPLLNKKNIIGGGLYYEYRTDDARLCIEVIKKAVEYGAFCINYAKFNKPIYENGRLAGAEVIDILDKSVFEIRAKCVINATGPWVDLIRKLDNSLNQKRLMLTKGIHIVVPYSVLPIKQAVYFEIKDKRMLFAIPRQNKTYIGTTDTVYNQDIDSPNISINDIKYLIKGCNYMFPKIKISPNDIISKWAGLRPLVHEDGKSPSEVSRKDEIFISDSGLITIAGGKLTGYRKMAEKTVNLIVKKLNANVSKCKTANLAVSGGDFRNADEIRTFIIQLTTQNRLIGLSVDKIKEWVGRYGSETPRLIEFYKKIHTKNSDKDISFVLAELEYCIIYECIVTLSDFFVRRSSKLYFDPSNVTIYLNECAVYLQKRLMFSKKEINKQIEELNFLLKEATSIPEDSV